jgi:hypothetical protein
LFNVCHFIQSVTIKKLSSWFKNRSQKIIFSVYDLSPPQTIIPNLWMSALPTIKLICFHRNSAYLIGKMVSFSLNGILCKLLMFKWNILYYLTSNWAFNSSFQKKYIYRVSTLKVEHRQLTLCIQLIDIMPLFRYINNMY